jgi:serine/threonine protein kinase
MPTLTQVTDDLSAIGLVAADALRTFDDVLPVEARSHETVAHETLAHETRPNDAGPNEAQNLVRALARTGHLARRGASTPLVGQALKLVFGEYVVLDRLDNAGVTQEMDFVECRNLNTVMRERGPLPYAEAIDYVLQGARGLADVHERGGVHGDVNPSNLLLDDLGTIKVLEAGLSRLDEWNSNEFSSRQDSLPFTLSFMAPEQRIDPRSCDARSDIYSLGCIFYSLLAGTLPSPSHVLPRADTGAETGPDSGAAADSPVPLLAALRATRGDLPHALGRILELMTAILPDNRFATMKEVVAELELLAAIAEIAAQIPSATAKIEAPREAQTCRGPLAVPNPRWIVPVAALEKSRYFVAKMAGAISATIIPWWNSPP